MLDIPTKYCESLIGYFFPQPLNIISNVAFLIAAFLAYRYLRNHRVSRLYILPILLGIIGIGSAWWHITNSRLGDILDTFSIVLFASVAVLLLLTEIAKSKVVTALSFILLLSLVLITERFAAWNGSLPYVVLLIGFVIIGVIYIKKIPSAKSVFLSAILIFLIAIVFRSVDIILCPCIPFGTHFLWHVLLAGLGYQIILMLANAKNK